MAANVRRQRCNDPLLGIWFRWNWARRLDVKLTLVGSRALWSLLEQYLAADNPVENMGPGRYGPILCSGVGRKWKVNIRRRRGCRLCG